MFGRTVNNPLALLQTGHPVIYKNRRKKKDKKTKNKTAFAEVISISHISADWAELEGESASSPGPALRAPPSF